MDRTSSFAVALALMISGCSGSHVSVSCSKDGDCDDGIFCNGTETCDTKHHKCASASPPPCSDNVDCTTDLCDELAKGCVHIADSNQCTAGHTCDVKGDCVPACDPAACTATCTGAGYVEGFCGGTAFCQCTAPTPPPINTLSGHAFLFGHTAGDAAHDHSAITVGLAGTTITATTAADGSYSLMNVPAGVYTVTASHDKYVPGNAQAVVVASPAPAPPAITLNHGKLAGTMSSDAELISVAIDNVIYSPDSSHVLVSVAGMSISGNTGVDQLFAFPTNLTSPPVDLFNLENKAKASLSISVFPEYGISNDHLVFMDSVGNVSDAVWSRPLDGSAPAIVLATAPAPSPGATSATEGNVEMIGNVGKFALIETFDLKSNQYSWNAAPTDGSAAIAVWKPNTVEPTYFYNDDNVVVFGTVATGPAVTMHSFNLTTSVDTFVVLPSYTALTGANAITPDHQWVIGNGTQSGNQHVFVLKVGTTTVSVASNNSSASSFTPLSDSSGFAYTDETAGGFWFFGTTVTPTPGNPVAVVPAASYESSSGTVQPALKGHVVYYTDAAATHAVSLASIPQTGSTSVVRASMAPSPAPWLDGNGVALIQAEVAANEGSANVVWVSSTSVGQIQGVTANFPLSGPTAVNLGNPLSNDCLNTLSETHAFANGFYYTCHDTATLNGHPAPLTGGAPTAVDTGVAGPPFPLVSSRRAAYQKLDGTIWSASGGNKAMLSRFAPGIMGPPVNIDPWVFTYDHDAQLARVSNVSGTVIDEPLTACNIVYATESLDSNPPAALPTKLTDSVLTAATACSFNNFNAYSVALTNLP